MAKVNKDFYNDLPGMVCIMLDKFITNYGKEPWFPKAWEEYRQHIKSSDMDNMKMPGFVFNKYLKKDIIKHFATQDSDVIYGVPQQKKFPLPDADHVRSAIKFFNYVEPKYEVQLARAILKRAEQYKVNLTEMNIGDENRFKKYLANDELKHYGIKGQKWGQRRFQNEDGTLTPEGRERYFGNHSKKRVFESEYIKVERGLGNKQDQSGIKAINYLYNNASISQQKKWKDKEDRREYARQLYNKDQTYKELYDQYENDLNDYKKFVGKYSNKLIKGL